MKNMTLEQAIATADYWAAENGQEQRVYHRPNRFGDHYVVHQHPLRPGEWTPYPRHIVYSTVLGRIDVREEAA